MSPAQKTVCDTPEKKLQHFEHLRDRLTTLAFIPAAKWWSHVKTATALLRFPRLKSLYLFDVNNEVIDSIENMLLKGYLPCVTAIFFRAVKGFSSEYLVNENRFSGWIISESVWDTILDENDEPICLKLVLKPNIELSGELKTAPDPVP